MPTFAEMDEMQNALQKIDEEARANSNDAFNKMFIQLHKTFILDLMIIAMREAIQASKKGEIHKLWTFLAVYHWLREKKIALS